MIRVVLDTNIIISGWLWSGSPRQVLNIARQRRVQTVISEAILDELNRPKFASRLIYIAKTVEEILANYLLFTEIVEPPRLAPVIDRDPDDDAVLACAVGGKADLIVTGDDHLLALKNFREIRIVNANQFLSIIEPSE